MANVVNAYSTSGDSVASIGLVLPTVLDEDIAVAFIGLSTTDTISPPAGYTQIQNTTFATATRRFAAYWKLLDAGTDSGASHDWTFTSSNAVLQLVIVRKAATSSTINSSAVTTGTGTDWVVAAPSIASNEVSVLGLYAGAGNSSAAPAAGFNGSDFRALTHYVTGAAATNISMGFGVSEAAGNFIGYGRGVYGASVAFASIGVQVTHRSPDTADFPSEGISVTYDMRAYNTDLSAHVYWQVATVPDTAGTQSGYSPGDLEDIVVLGKFPL
jgi:hypothetical protein